MEAGGAPGQTPQLQSGRHAPDAVTASNIPQPTTTLRVPLSQDVTSGHPARLLIFT